MFQARHDIFFADKMAKGNVELLDLPTEESDLMKITPLGSGQEVGRSCHIVQFKVQINSHELSNSTYYH